MMKLQIPERDGMPLLVCNYSRPRDRMTGKHMRSAWRVDVYCAGDSRYAEMTPYVAINCAFASKQDAERGLKALLEAGLDTLEKLIERRDDLNKIMCAALPW